MKSKKISLVILFLLTCTGFGCREVAIPKPKGYFRIDLPAKQYQAFDIKSSKTTDMPFTFEYPAYGNLSFQAGHNDEPGWFNIEFQAYRAKIYFTYKEIDNDFNRLMEQTYKMNVKNHISKADAINEHVISNQEDKIYGILYDLKGNTASAVQFYVTDSVNHYLRGSLYFSSEPNADSLAPVIEFFREDIIHLIETLKWTEI
ncbi:MAG: gliding motility lipoprotein GldD [Bacteroidales bacterium]|nr:gliding motility lipoprotein GldD [Bacteroidales bacterium]